MNIPITAQDWYKVRNEEEWSLALFFSFYKDNGGILDNIITFGEVFTKICMLPHFINSKGIFVRVTHELSILKVFEYYDRKYGRHQGDKTEGST
jgi:hypothetical protein